MGERARWAVRLALPAVLVLGLAACSALRPGAGTRRPRWSRPTADCLSAQVLARPRARHARRGRRGRARPWSTPRRRAACPDDFLAGERRRLHPWRHAARLVGHLGRAHGEPARGQPRRRSSSALRRAAGAAGRHVQLGAVGLARAVAGRRAGPGDPTRVADRPVRRTPAGRSLDGARRARGDGQRAVPRAPAGARLRRARLPDAYSLRNRTRSTAWSGPLVSTSVARPRVGRMFCSRLGSLIESQIRSARRRPPRR